MKVGDIEHIIVIESLEGERQTGNELYNDCIVRNIDRLKSNISAVFRSVNSKEGFRDVFKFYQNKSSEMKGGILVHLEMHGDVDFRGVVLLNRDLITWEEVVELCRPINIITRNQLYLSFASCHGRDLYKGVDLNLKCPYSGYISASTDILPEEIVEKYTLLFENLIETGNLVNACLYMQENGSRFFIKILKRYFCNPLKIPTTDFSWIQNFVQFGERK